MRSALSARSRVHEYSYFSTGCRHRFPKSREISRENNGIFAHMWHQRSLLGVNQSRPVTLKQSNQSGLTRFLNYIKETLFECLYNVLTCLMTYLMQLTHQT